MHMWGEFFPNRVQSECSCSVVNKDICDFLVVEDDLDVLDIVLYPYTGMDWSGCTNIHFTKDEPPNDRGNIILMF